MPRAYGVSLRNQHPMVEYLRDHGDNFPRHRYPSPEGTIGAVWGQCTFHASGSATCSKDHIAKLLSVAPREKYSIELRLLVARGRSL